MPTAPEPGFPEADARRILRIALSEDCGSGDITCALTVPADHQSHGQLVARATGILAGLPLLPIVFEELAAIHPASGAERVRIECDKSDGDEVSDGDRIALLSGPTCAILEAERTLLNFLQRLSGTATVARHYQKVAGPTCKVLDTRKTTPGLRTLEKYAIRMGGGSNHRMGLWDAVLIKENHARAAGGVRAAALAALERLPQGMPLIVEVETMEEFESLLDLPITRVLLDNFPPDSVVEAVTLRNARKPDLPLEASGGITLQNLWQYASTGIDYASVGALTHSVKALDLSFLLEIES